MKRYFIISAHLFGLASVTFLCLSPAMGQSAYFSLEGDFNVAADQHDFFFDLSRIVGSTEDLRFVTYASFGGTRSRPAGSTRCWCGSTALYTPIRATRAHQHKESAKKGVFRPRRCYNKRHGFGLRERSS